jgi:hypothetical protein
MVSKDAWRSKNYKKIENFSQILFRNPLPHLSFIVKFILGKKCFKKKRKSLKIKEKIIIIASIYYFSSSASVKESESHMPCVNAYESVGETFFSRSTEISTDIEA